MTIVSFAPISRPILVFAWFGTAKSAYSILPCFSLAAATNAVIDLGRG